MGSGEPTKDESGCWLMNLDRSPARLTTRSESDLSSTVSFFNKGRILSFLCQVKCNVIPKRHRDGDKWSDESKRHAAQNAKDRWTAICGKAVDHKFWLAKLQCVDRYRLDNRYDRECRMLLRPKWFRIRMGKFSKKGTFFLETCIASCATLKSVYFHRSSRSIGRSVPCGRVGAKRSSGMNVDDRGVWIWLCRTNGRLIDCW